MFLVTSSYVALILHGKDKRGRHVAKETLIRMFSFVLMSSSGVVYMYTCKSRLGALP